jgi:ABC-type branched-subunit amino acid transport system ATPase component
MLEIKGLDTGYGKKQILYGIDLEAVAGKITAIIGPNGSGKSTLLKAAFGLIPVWQGKVFFQQADITKHNTKFLVQNGITFVPQGNRVFDEMSVLENLEIGGLYLSKKQFQIELEKIWQLFPELQKRKKQNSGKLSGGEKQQLSLGRALMPDPTLLLMDEPSLGLSPKLVSQMMNHLRKINREFGKTILIVEQKVRDVLEICDHVYSIKLGRITYSGPPEPLKSDTGKMKELFL